jgi:hypothetical protein
LGTFEDATGCKYVVTEFMNRGSLLDVLKKKKGELTPFQRVKM